MTRVEIVARQQWGALDARDSARLDPHQRRGVVLHWNGPKMAQPDHDGCPALVRSIQRYHMQAKGWTDGAYSYVVCQHGVVYELRGRYLAQWANGSLAAPAGTGDTSLRPAESWYTVMCLTGGDHDKQGRLVDEQKPSRDMLTALAGLIGLLRAWGAGSRVLPHRAFRIKTCPGDILAAWCARWNGRPPYPPADFVEAPAPPDPIKEILDMQPAELEAILTRAVVNGVNASMAAWLPRMVAGIHGEPNRFFPDADRYDDDEQAIRETNEQSLVVLREIRAELADDEPEGAPPAVPAG